MKIGPFKMKGFSGFGNDSPAKHATGVVGQGSVGQIMGNNGLFGIGKGNEKNNLFTGMAGAQAGKALITKETRKRKGGSKRRGMGALDMFSGIKGLFS